MKRLSWATLLAPALLAGCATSEIPPSPSMDKVYDQFHQQGGADAVNLIREGLRERQVYGASDPYIPMRQPDQVVPVWIVPHRDPDNGRRVSGHWEHTVIEQSEWETE